MIITVKLLFSILLFVVLSPFTYAKPLQSNGYNAQAIDVTTGKLRYTEEYQEHWKEGKLVKSTVIYRLPLGKPVAKKILIIDQNLSQPSFRFDDDRDGYLKGVEALGNKYKIFYRLTRQEPIKEKIMKIPKPVTWDAGIHYFILQHWEVLMAGQDLVVNFVVPKQLDYYKLRITKGKETQINQRSVIQIEIEPDSFLLGLAAGIVGKGSNVVTYDLKTKQVIQYQGVSGIHDKNGESYEVNIGYHYFGTTKN